MAVVRQTRCWGGILEFFIWVAWLLEERVILGLAWVSETQSPLPATQQTSSNKPYVVQQTTLIPYESMGLFLLKPLHFPYIRNEDSVYQHWLNNCVTDTLPFTVAIGLPCSKACLRALTIQRKELAD